MRERRRDRGRARSVARCSLAIASAALLLGSAACGHESGGLGADGVERGPIDQFDQYFGATSHDGSLWVVGYAGKIIHARQPEGPWTVQREWHARSLFDIDTLDGERLWAVGELGLLLHSPDGGETWERRDSGIEQENLLAVDFADAQIGFIVGEYGVMLRTRDGGRSWEPLPASSDAILSDVQFFDPDSGIVVGEFGTFMVTEDGGRTWVSPTQRFSDEETYLYGLRFRNPLEGVVTGLEGRIYETTDGGLSWEEHVLGEPVPLYDAYFRPGWEAKALSFGDRGVLFRRRAAAWTPLETGVFTFLRAAAFLDDSRGIVVGGEGTILRTEDGGRSWERLPRTGG